MPSMPLPLSLPTIQNWSCHSCGGCCRQHEIIITDAERQRILDQKWTEADGVPAGTKAFERIGSRHRLAHQADGACVFLDEHNHCRIHARFGEAAKPLACRIYPFAFHPAGDKIAISLRFSCPSVAANRGATMDQQRKDLLTLRDLVVPPNARDWPAPPISPNQQLDWPDTLRIIRRLEEVLCGPAETDAVEISLGTRLVHALFIVGMLGQATFEKVRGERLDELMDALITAAPLETQTASAEPLEQPDRSEPSSLAKTQFRLMVAQYATRDTTAAGGLGYRLGKMLSGLRFTRGHGLTPVMQPGLQPVLFADLEKSFDVAHHDIDPLFQRYFQVKLSGMAFCGPACYGLNVVEGFQSLALIYPLVMYIARWIARGQNRTSVELADAEKALNIVDHHHGYSPAMGRPNFRQRVRWLIGHNEIPRLIEWYGV